MVLYRLEHLTITLIRMMTGLRVCGRRSPLFQRPTSLAPRSSLPSVGPRLWLVMGFIFRAFARRKLLNSGTFWSRYLKTRKLPSLVQSLSFVKPVSMLLASIGAGPGTVRSKPAISGFEMPSKNPKLRNSSKTSVSESFFWPTVRDQILYQA